MAAEAPEPEAPPCSNELFNNLPFLADVLLPRLLPADVLALSCTCCAWRRTVQAAVESLAPKSELAVPFVSGCHRLQRLDVRRMLPAAPTTAAGSSLLAAIAPLTGLTQLLLDASLTAAWRGQALLLTPGDLQHLTACTALQALSLSHQCCVVLAASLAPLRHLAALTALNLSIAGTSCVPLATAWDVLQSLTGLVQLDLSGWATCLAQAQQHEGPAAAAGGDGVAGTSSGGSSSGRATSAIGRAFGRLMHGLSPSHAAAARHCACAASASAAAAAGGGGPAAAAAAARGDGSFSGCSTAAHIAAHEGMVECPAPLEALGSLSRLRQLVLADWRVPPSQRGLAALQALPLLTYLDISRCMDSAGAQQAQQGNAAAAAAQQHPNGDGSGSSSSSSGPTGLLALLQGASAQQQEPAQTAAPAAREAVPAAAPAAFFGSLQQLQCSRLAVTFEAAAWAALAHLTHLDVSACSRFRGLGLAQLTALQELVASDCAQLDYDAVRELLSTTRSLRRLDLERSTVILHGSGHTAAQLDSGRFTRPAAATQRYRQQQQQQWLAGGSSRRDAADVSGAEGAPKQPQQQQGQQGAPHGLREVHMSEVSLAFEAFVWRQHEPDANNPQTPSHPSLLLFDLVAAQSLQGVRVLHWNRADSVLAAAVLSQLVPAASSTLSELRLSSSSLPEDPSRCWQGLAAATNLRVLDLCHTGFGRQNYANTCGTNPTVALLAAVACMRLEVLGLAGWRFYFATLKPLAGLSDCLASVDLSRARDVTDSTLWSLTHLTSLTWLSVAGARASHDGLFALLFQHLSSLRHLDLSGITAFSARSLPSVLQLQGLTYLDIRSTAATADAATVATLVRLPNCKLLALSIGGTEGYERQQWQPLSEVACRRGSSAAALGPAAATGEGLSASYAFLGRLSEAQSLRQLLLGGSTPSLTEYCRSLLPPWVDVR